jgi:hypothetical protein
VRQRAEFEQRVERAASSVLGYEFNEPYCMICSTGYFTGIPPCPASRFPIAYPPYGSPTPP